jgi:DNA polymerase IV
MAHLDMPTVYLLSTHIEPGTLPQLQSQIPTLTFNIKEADIVLGKISKKERAIFELRRRGIVTAEVADESDDALPPAKRRRPLTTPPGSAGNASNSASESDSELSFEDGAGRHQDQLYKVVHLSWFTDSLSKGRVLPVQDYLIYRGRRVLPGGETRASPNSIDILRRARDEGENIPTLPHPFRGYLNAGKHSRTMLPPKRPALLHETTSEHDQDLDLPPVPNYLHTTYSCERPTPYDPPNHAFIEELKRIRTTRALSGDKVGVRAYSTCIASLAAYPYPLRSAQGVTKQAERTVRR